MSLRNEIHNTWESIWFKNFHLKKHFKKLNKWNILLFIVLFWSKLNKKFRMTCNNKKKYFYMLKYYHSIENLVGKTFYLFQV